MVGCRGGPQSRVVVQFGLWPALATQPFDKSVSKPKAPETQQNSETGPLSKNPIGL